MIYEVSCRDDWNQALKDQFGDCYSTHDLSGDEVVDAIIKHGRAEIRVIIGNDPARRVLEFQNNYD